MLKLIKCYCCVAAPVLGINMNIIYGTVRSTLRQVGEIKRPSTNGSIDQSHRNVLFTPHIFHFPTLRVFQLAHTYRHTVTRAATPAGLPGGLRTIYEPSEPLE